MKYPSNRVYDFAVAIINRNVKEVNQLLLILFEDYGIVPCYVLREMEDFTVKRISEQEDFELIRLKPEREDFYVPKVVGVVSPKPKGSLKMRRCLLY